MNSVPGCARRPPTYPRVKRSKVADVRTPGPDSEERCFPSKLIIVPPAFLLTLLILGVRDAGPEPLDHGGERVRAPPCPPARRAGVLSDVSSAMDLDALPYSPVPRSGGAGPWSAVYEAASRAAIVLFSARGDLPRLPPPSRGAGCRRRGALREARIVPALREGDGVAADPPKIDGRAARSAAALRVRFAQSTM